MTPERTSEDDEMLAAEHALGLLSGDELSEARRRAAEDRAFAASVADWEVRLASLSDEFQPERPDPAVKAALFAELFPTAKPESVWRRLWIWKAASVVSLLALVAFLALDLRGPTTPAGPLYSAEIAAEAGDFRVVAIVDKATDEVTLSRTRGAAPEGRILQVWAHGPGEPATSVGLWPEGETIRLPLPQEIAAVEGVLTLGVSEEPPGGSPTGSPSGRVFGTVDIPGVSGTF